MSSKRFFLAVPVLASLAAYSPLTPAALVHAQGAPDSVATTDHRAADKETTLSVSATGRVERTPDYLDVVVGIVQDDATASEAQAAAQDAMAKVIAAVRALNLDELDLKTGTVSLEPRHEQRDRYDNSPKIVGYRASISIRVRTSNLEASAKIIDAGLTSGANQIQSVSFGIKEALEAREEAIMLAGKAAKRKAATLASALDLKLGRVVNASENSQQQVWYANRMANEASFSGPGSGQDVIVPGKIEITAEVSVTYAAE